MDQIPPGTDLSKVPLGVNPSGAPPNFVNPPTLVHSVQAIGVVLAIISLFLVCVRLGVYRTISRGILLDDASIIIAFVFAITYTVIVSTLDKASHHAWDTPMSLFDDADYLKKLFVTSLIYGPMLFFAKTSILLLYHRAFHPKKWLRFGVYITIAILFGSYFMTVPMAFYWCMPHNAPWNMAVLGTCNMMATPGLVQGSINIAADITIFLLPLPVIMRLQIPTSKKIALSAIFATGLLALVASILTMYYRVLIIRGVDSSWAGAQTYICIQAEIYAAICVACMPSMARVWKIKYKETKFYASIQSLLHTMRGTTSKGTQKSEQSTTAISSPRRHSHSSIDSLTAYEKEPDEESKVGGSMEDLRVSEEDSEVQHRGGSGIFRTLEVDVTSEKGPTRTDAPRAF
ncbi:hypothetical protein BU16DRAFT_473457 [Lophium mytilinum]|uniref:Rhodopsin domain-containing protein n=1 Tax=Lophium mytilinum TaxID=390894 RepID=A0A6A6Q967_9PEZI|nr:hypothetical protein BU16DRAFT_473457 [Lophium mytilinum]